MHRPMGNPAKAVAARPGNISVCADAIESLARLCRDAVQKASRTLRADGRWSPAAQASTVVDVLELMYLVNTPNRRPTAPHLNDTGVDTLQFLLDVQQWCLEVRAAATRGADQSPLSHDPSDDHDLAPPPAPPASCPAPKAGKTEINLAVREHLLANPLATQREAARAIGCSVSAVGRTRAWRAVAEARRQYAPAGAPKAVSLSHGLEQQLDDRDDLLRRLIHEQKQDDSQTCVYPRERV